MPRRAHPFRTGATYHLYNRGHNRQTVFRCGSDYLTFLQAMRTYLDVVPADAAQASGATLLAYCLMPNHFHLVVQPEDETLSARMQRLLISFTKTLNAKYERVGALFQGQFHAVRVEADGQLIQLTAYVHRNPVEAGLVRRSQDWEYSSCREYLGTRPGTLPDPSLVLDLCGGRRAYRRLIDTKIEQGSECLEHLVLEG
jgi:REP element-mobilizing transposase RayT